MSTHMKKLKPHFLKSQTKRFQILLCNSSTSRKQETSYHVLFSNVAFNVATGMIFLEKL